MNAPPVQYVTTSDGFNIAYTVAGNGRALLFMHPFGHVQNDWLNPAVGPWLQALSQRLRLVQYDCRGQGMSTRGLRGDLSTEDYERDIEAIAEHLHIDRFVLLGSFWYGHVAARYAARHPENVEALVMLHCSVGQYHLISSDLARQNWDVFLETLVTAPTWTAEQRLAAIESFRQSTTQADWLVQEAVFSRSDVGGVLPGLRVPVLVLHARDNNRQSPDESARLAALVPGAQLTLIEGSSQLGDAISGMQAIESFLSGLPVAADGTGPRALRSPAHPDALSGRELEVLRLLAAGKSNQQIADELVISVNTVNRHVSNIYAKTGAANRAQATAYAKDHGIA